ncbi:PDDEXK nuclease domain-containing protein [Cellulosimicrobium sp. TH-20]|uniref:PDDEXK nuclease domain-containing protein n=1 Tax=Cellulosimicrobium sp. TH-20 TaxID=1980001 RepID=UPI00210385E0|nr:PDDEXK nuclease domain-containing protein [Cellulosimicrobium sp. TH-20]
MPADSELAQLLVRDPYVFDHLGLSGRIQEREFAQGLMDRLQETLLEFGSGMAFVGRQVRFTVHGDELVIDLLLFLLVAGRNEAIVRYALAGTPAPLSVANSTYDSLPPTSKPHSPAPMSSPPTSNARPTGTTQTGRNGSYRLRRRASRI